MVRVGILKGSWRGKRGTLIRSAHRFSLVDFGEGAAAWVHNNYIISLTQSHRGARVEGSMGGGGRVVAGADAGRCGQVYATGEVQ